MECGPRLPSYIMRGVKRWALQNAYAEAMAKIRRYDLEERGHNTHLNIDEWMAHIHYLEEQVESRRAQAEAALCNEI